MQGSCWPKPNRQNPTGRDPECTLDRFLGGRIIAAQPKNGFRAGHDTVLLAAAVPDEPGARVLELGSGAGIASLCLAARASVSVTGIEIDAVLVDIANANAERNGIAGRVHFVRADVMDVPAGEFEHVFFNPPFHQQQGTPSATKALNVAKRSTGDTLSVWTSTALRVARSGGTVTAIVAFDRLEDLLSNAEGQATLVFPLYPRIGIKPKRAIVRIHAGTAGSAQMLRGMVLHEHDGRNTEEAEAVLRLARPIVLS